MEIKFIQIGLIIIYSEIYTFYVIYVTIKVINIDLNSKKVEQFAKLEN